MIEKLDQAIERLYDLKVGVVGTGPDRHGGPAPLRSFGGVGHKPLLLQPVFDMLDDGLATPDHIPWCDALRQRFTARFQIVRARDDDNTPDNRSRRSPPPPTTQAAAYASASVPAPFPPSSTPPT